MRAQFSSVFGFSCNPLNYKIRLRVFVFVFYVYSYMSRTLYTVAELDVNPTIRIKIANDPIDDGQFLAHVDIAGDSIVDENQSAKREAGRGRLPSQRQVNFGLRLGPA